MNQHEFTFWVKFSLPLPMLMPESNQTVMSMVWFWHVTSVSRNMICKTPSSRHPLFPYKEVGTVTSYEPNMIAGVFFPTQGVFRRIYHTLSAHTSGLDENTRVSRHNERWSTSESKQSIFWGFTRNIQGELTRKNKTTSFVSNWTWLHKKITLI